MSSHPVDILRVFSDSRGRFGNPLAVFLDGAGVPSGRRQEIAACLGLSETVFVDDPVAGAVRIFTPRAELALAGHPLVGTGWLLAEQGTPVAALSPPAGRVPTWQEGELTWIAASPDACPPFELRRLGGAAHVDAQAAPERGDALQLCWAWEDESAGAIRARVFASALGVSEDEATGSAAIVLTAALGCALRIRQGRGSVIVTRPVGDGSVALGGHVVRDERREFRL